MVFAFHGKEISEFELEDVCETSWFGNTCGEIVEGIKKLGFYAEEIDQITIKYLTAQLNKKYPFIALIDPAVLYGGIEGFGHFVVITGIEDDRIYYHDPDLNKDLSKNIADFMKAWKKFSCKGVRIWKSLKK